MIYVGIIWLGSLAVFLCSADQVLMIEDDPLTSGGAA